MNRTGFIGLFKADFPDGAACLCDGGYIVWNGDTYRSVHPVLGSMASVETMEEGRGAMVPAQEITFLPPASATPAELAQPGWQKVRARCWLAEYDVATNVVIGTPTLLFDGFLDQAMLEIGERRELTISIVSWLEQLFERNTGNSLSSSFHKTVWPGETGHDNGTGLSQQVAWGVESPVKTKPVWPFRMPAMHDIEKLIR